MNDDEKPDIDGTPAWAYDADGYCVCCGNGRWKHHMPDCELRDALDAAAIARDVAAASPLDYEDRAPTDEANFCHFCEVPLPRTRWDDLRALDWHAESCPWRRARELMGDSGE